MTMLENEQKDIQRSIISCERRPTLPFLKVSIESYIAK